MARAQRCQVHGHTWHRGCKGCQEYWRVTHNNRARLTAYGQWPVSTVDAGPARQHLTRLYAAGMSTRRISTITGVSRFVIRAVRQGQPKVRDYLAAAILGCPVKLPSDLISPVGVSRRLQALSRNRYSIDDLSMLLERRPIIVARWRAGTHPITKHTYQLVCDLYDRLWCTEGPSPRAEAHAKRVGYLPSDAWTDENVDDPGTQPYSHVEEEIVDEVLIRAVLRLGRPFLDLSDAERLRLYAMHIGEGRTTRSFRDRYRVPADVLRWLQAQVLDREQA